MKKAVLLVVFACRLMSAVAADEHPKAAEIQQYLNENPIEPRIPELLIEISQKSSDLNEAGHWSHLEKRYNEAIALFREAIEFDDDNSFAWYNMARSYALMGGNYYGEVMEPLEKAVQREWFWGLKLMVDPDLNAWRYARLDTTFYENPQQTPECPAFVHVFRPDGTVTLQAWLDCGEPPREIATGYYSVVSWRVFEFFPEVETYVTDGPNGSITVPRRANQVRFPKVHLPK